MRVGITSGFNNTRNMQLQTNNNSKSKANSQPSFGSLHLAESEFNDMHRVPTTVGKKVFNVIKVIVMSAVDNAVPAFQKVDKDLINAGKEAKISITPVRDGLLVEFAEKKTLPEWVKSLFKEAEEPLFAYNLRYDKLLPDWEKLINAGEGTKRKMGEKNIHKEMLKAISRNENPDVEAVTEKLVAAAQKGKEEYLTKMGTDGDNVKKISTPSPEDQRISA